MNAVDAREEMYELVEVDGMVCAFTNARIDRQTVSDSLCCYDVRDSDLCEGIFAEIRPHVLVNHWGTILCKIPFPLDDDGSYYPRKEENYLSESVTMKEYEMRELTLSEDQEFMIMKQ